ncbi:MAG: HEPN domain-containing protein [Janthinobacterium lividum]
MQPSTPEQQRVDILMRRADRDIQVAELIVQASPHLYEDAGFHCQQATEKYLKAVLIAATLPAPFTHNLVVLMASLRQASVVAFAQHEIDEATVLTDFAVGLRYELDDAPSYTAADLLAMADRFRQKLRPLAQAFLL